MMINHSKLSKLVFSVLFVFCLTTIAEAQHGASSHYKTSNNDQKVRKLLPGEEVVTPTGKKLKVWDTSGPVPVSQAFESAREKQLPAGTRIVVDDRIQGQIQRGAESIGAGDSFDFN